MGYRQKRAGTRKVKVGVAYGMGGSASAELPREEVAGKSARETRRIPRRLSVSMPFGSLPKPSISTFMRRARSTRR